MWNMLQEGIKPELHGTKIKQAEGPELQRIISQHAPARTENQTCTSMQEPLGIYIYTICTGHIEYIEVKN